MTIGVVLKTVFFGLVVAVIPGIQGRQLLDNLRCQLGKYGGEVTEGEVSATVIRQRR